SDPDGKVAILDNAIAGGISVAIGYGISRITGEDYTWKDAGIDFALGFATEGISALSKVAKVSKLGRFAIRAGLEAIVATEADLAHRSVHGEEFGADYDGTDIARGTFRNFLMAEGTRFGL